MIIVNNVSIGNNGLSLNINIETGSGYIITSAKLWTEDTFKDSNNFKDLNIHLEQINNKEILIIESSQLGMANYNGIMFLEFKSNEPDSEECSTCSEPIIVVVTDMHQYYRCMTEEILKSDLCNSNLFSSEVCDSNPVNKAITISLVMDAVTQCLELGQFVEAIDLMKKLKKICDKCNSCKKINKEKTCNSCNTYVY